jgi:Flp pilus assembly pilin Flp
VLTRPTSRQSAQGLVEYALILALVVLIVILALVLTGGQVSNLYSDITTQMCKARLGC